MKRPKFGPEGLCKCCTAVFQRGHSRVPPFHVQLLPIVCVRGCSHLSPERLTGLGRAPLSVHPCCYLDHHSGRASCARLHGILRFPFWHMNRVGLQKSTWHRRLPRVRSSTSDMEDSGHSSAADAQSTEALHMMQSAVRGTARQRGADDLPAAADQLSPPLARATQLVQWYRSSGRRGRLHVALVTGEGADMLLAEQATEALSFLCCVPSHSSVPPKRESDA